MRIISGINRGMKLISPKNDKSRPTSDRVKESLFNILGNVHNVTVLDLFCGVGSIGLEFISRGAKSVVFVDNDKDISKILHSNIEKTKATNWKFIKADYMSALKSLKNEKFDYIYIDPPYNKDYFYNNSIKYILDYNMVDGYIIIESKIDLKIPEINRLNIIDQRKYGDTIITIAREAKA